jgi:DNA-binding response OmpR family regulator
MLPTHPLARLLLVEDHDDAREMYCEMLGRAGYAVVPAVDGEEALAHATKERFDLIILDVALPKVHGITVLRILRGQPRTQSIPVITLSATVGDRMHKAVLAAGANLALDKPCLPHELEAAVRALLLSEGRNPSS